MSLSKQSDSPYSDMDAGKDRHSEGAFVHRREISSTSVSVPLRYRATVPGLFENLSDEPNVPERIRHSALQHPSDGTRPGHSVRVFLVWTKNSSCPLPQARTSLQVQANDKSGSVDPLLGPDCTLVYVPALASLYMRLPHMNRCLYLYADAACWR
jgi:hypothetical protein